MTYRAIIAFGVAATASMPAAASAGPALASDWTPMETSQAECFTRGEAAIRQLGFGTIERTRFSRFGVGSEYTVAVRCIEEVRVVLFLATGPERERAQALQMELHQNYVK